MPGESRQIQIKNIHVQGDLILAPMDGYSSWPFRSLCRELGSAISYTEFVKAGDVLVRPHYIQDKLYFTEKERPVFFQLYGHDLEMILAAALILQESEPDAIDINLGCPNRSITSRGAGAGLMRTPIKVARIFKQLSQTLDVPVTGKIRLGWQSCQNQLLIARIIEEYGGSLLAVHGRTKEQGHQGEPNLLAVAEIKKALSIPVIGNGGITQVSDIQNMVELTGCDGVMIGRAAMKNPWIFSGLDREEISPHQVKKHLLEHLERSLSFYGKEVGLVLFRKFTAGYLAPYDLDRETRRELLTETDANKFIQLVGDVFKKMED
ncbi:MAG: tRNA-dihydrouridine synthase family protein [Chloroflexi bacterium]|nr:tRNA-dihydrouridine synthase family protein [Chloroflexota bacterium]